VPSTAGQIDQLGYSGRRPAGREGAALTNRRATPSHRGAGAARAAYAGQYRGRSGSRAGPGSLSCGGINNTYFWIDPSRAIAGLILMQYLPFADAKALAVYDAFEWGAYQVVSATRSGRNRHWSVGSTPV